jgi:hypothetical protein
MRTKTMILVALALVSASAFAGTHSMTVLVGDTPAREYHHDSTVYIEALRGRDFAIRITNPTPYRVAVALSVDGLNTIDARHTDAWSARKWVLDPWESTVISGWQVDQNNARRFYFTGEMSSYGATLGKTENLGVIEAVFYRERTRRRDANLAPRSAPPPVGAPSGAGTAESSKSGALSDEYAATGMGERDRHEVDSVDIDLDPHPIASARVRYEFRAQLVKLGVVLDRSPLERRESARGFGAFCPEP